MKDVARFTAGYAGLAVTTALGLMVLSACSSEPQKTSGLLDEVKYSGAVKSVPAKTHTDTRREAKTKRSCSGSGTKKTCSTVPDGFKTIKVVVTDKPAKPGKSAIWCVELDNVNGKPNEDDRLFEVSWETYSKWENEGEGTKVTDMVYVRSVASCKR